jgi:hypothetical protein
MRNTPTAFFCLSLLLLCVLACAGVKNPLRDYTPKDFNSAEWLAGDRVERGRMVQNMYRNPELKISTREDAVRTLGEPDLKKTIENNEVWFYRVDIGIVGGMDLIPISFDPKGRGSYGYAHGGTMSIMAKEDEL